VQSYAPRLGLSHLFLTRGLLSLAALHHSHIRSLQRVFYRGQALIQHDKALHEFHTVLVAIDESNLDAAFLFASLLVANTFALKILDTLEASNIDALSSIYDCLFLVRGTSAILKPFGAILKAGELRQLLIERQEPQSMDRAAKTPELSALAAEFAKTAHERDGVAANAYVGAIEELQPIFASMQALTLSGERPDTGLIMRWPIEISENFITMLKTRKPEALVILAYYATTLNYGNGMYNSRRRP
jgi:hypothetical protein